jgi:putative tricarboxylic transport membrane protein
MEKVNFSTAPIVLGIVLGSLAEEELRRSLVISGGDISIFFTRPISLTLLVLAVVGIITPYYRNYKMRKTAA